MNQNNFNQIVTHYIEQFERLNDSEHEEYYKWQVAAQFKPMMDKALAVYDDDFPVALMDLKKATFNLIDSYTQPFYGLCKFAEEEPQTVKQMFLDLYQDDGEDLKTREDKIVAFLNQSHALGDRYYPESYLYNDDFHSVTCYLFLYDPDHNYIYKATHAREFADCIEFYDDWGYGENVKLDVYYRMCDEVLEAAKNHATLMETDASRSAFSQDDKQPLHPDQEKHILVFDLIYCCSAYGLFDGISYEKPNSKARQLFRERKEKALQLFDKLTEAKEELQRYQEVKDDVKTLLCKGTKDGYVVTYFKPKRGYDYYLSEKKGKAK